MLHACGLCPILQTSTNRFLLYHWFSFILKGKGESRRLAKHCVLWSVNFYILSTESSSEKVYVTDNVSRRDTVTK